MGAQAAGRIHPLKVCVTAAAVVNPGCALTDLNAEEAAGSPLSAACRSRRYCHVRSLVRYPQHRTLPRPTEPVCLPPSCARSAKNQHSRRSSCVPASLDLATCDARSVSKDSACRLRRTCAESAAGVPGLAFSDRSLAQERREAARQPRDGKIKGARCGPVPLRVGRLGNWSSRVPPARASEARSSATRRRSFAAARHCNFTSRYNFTSQCKFNRG